jgi:hypothetical protein
MTGRLLNSRSETYLTAGSLRLTFWNTFLVACCSGGSTSIQLILQNCEAEHGQQRIGTYHAASLAPIQRAVFPHSDFLHPFRFLIVDLAISQAGFVERLHLHQTPYEPLVVFAQP